MKLTLSWLKDHLETDAELAHVAEMMNAIGMEVEEVFDPREKFSLFSVGYVKSRAKHPDADKLSVCEVETRDGLQQIVCGASNVRGGLKIAYAPVGAYVPGIDVTLSKAKIRGVESFGMICSSKELELGDDHDGIMELPDHAEIGANLADTLGLEPVIDYAVTPNRPDWLGVRGVARDLAAAGLGRLKPDPNPTVPASHADSHPVALEFDAEVADACPLFAARLITGVKNRPSPDWLQDRLRAVGLRPISAVVDVTNYVAHDRCRPLHAYDADTLQGAVRARLAAQGETVLALDGETYELTGEECVIADDSGAIGLGGVIGGETTGSTMETVNVLLEAAWFDPIRTAKTGRRHGIDTDARRRFERGVDAERTLEDLNHAAALLIELCGGAASEVAVAGAPPPRTHYVAFDPKTVARLGGVDYGAEETARRLHALGFEVDMATTRWSVRAPAWRPDVDGPADLVEEVLRLDGYAKAPTTPLPPLDKPFAGKVSVESDRARLARFALAGMGYLEAVTWSFMRPDWAKLFGGEDSALALENPIASELSQMRPSILPNLLDALRRNADRGFPGARLFEVGPIYAGDAPGDQTRSAAAVIDPRPGRHWKGAEVPDVFTMKADALAALEAAGAPARTAQIVAEAPEWWHPGRAGVIRLGPQRPLAVFGEVHPAVLKALDIDFRALGFELMLDNIPAPKSAAKTRPALESSALMPLHRDFAFVVAKDVAAEAALKAARGADKGLIADIRVFDVYEGANVGADEKSLALEVVIQPKAKTLTDAEIEALSAKIVAQVEKATGGKLRS